MRCSDLSTFGRSFDSSKGSSSARICRMARPPDDGGGMPQISHTRYGPHSASRLIGL
jgi:hypothetical protein